MAEIYGLFDPETGALRYIGKANNSAKRLKQHLREYRRSKTPVYAWIGKLVRKGLSPEMRVLETADDWREAERRLIADARARGVRILNVADGGDEPGCSLETRQANGRRLVERIRTDEHFRRMWHLKRELTTLLRDGLVRNSTRAKLRDLAELRPDLYGQWASIPDRIEDENGHLVGGYVRLKGGRFGAPLQTNP
jgi:hypothetical protein